MQVQSLGWEDPLEEGRATHSSVLVWRVPWTEEPGGLQSMGSKRVGYHWSDLAAAAAVSHFNTHMPFPQLLLGKVEVDKYNPLRRPSRNRHSHTRERVCFNVTVNSTQQFHKLLLSTCSLGHLAGDLLPNLRSFHSSWGRRRRER